MFEDPGPLLERLWSWLSRNSLLVYAGLTGICLIVIVLLLFANGILGGHAVDIPKNVTKQTKSSIYLPSQLPGNYKIDEDSFTTAEEGSALIFKAKDGVGADLIFSEQPRPKNFDFQGFYKSQLKGVKTLNDVRYPSVWGKSLDGRTALSVVSDDTWILMFTTAPLNQEDMVRIAASIQRQ